MIYETQARYIAAQNAFADASISLLSRVKGENTPESIQPLNNLAHLLYESGENSRAETLVRRNLAIQNANGKSDADTGAELRILGKICLGESKYAEAKEATENALEILRRVNDTQGPAAAPAYSVLGAVYSAYHEGGGGRVSQTLADRTAPRACTRRFTVSAKPWPTWVSYRPRATEAEPWTLPVPEPLYHGTSWTRVRFENPRDRFHLPGSSREDVLLAAHR